MERSRIGVGFYVVALSILVCANLQASSGTEGASFLDIPVGAGPAALGSAYSSLATDAYAPVWNPAGLGFLDSTQIAGQYLSYLQSMNYEFMSAVHPLRPGDSVGFSAQYLGSGNIAGTDQYGNSIGSYSDTFGAYSLAYGHAFNDKLSLGITGKIIHATLDDVSASAYAADFGTLYKVNDKINVAAVIANAGSHLTFLSEGDSLPLSFRLGSTYRPSSHWMLTGEADVPASGPLEFVEKLAALIPPARVHLTRFFGCLAPHAKIRSQIVPPQAADQANPPKTTPERPKRAKRWAELLARVFGIDMSTCPDCGGPFKIIAAILDPHAITSILTHLKLPDKPPGLVPARIPEQFQFS